MERMTHIGFHTNFCASVCVCACVRACDSLSGDFNEGTDRLLGNSMATEFIYEMFDGGDDDDVSFSFGDSQSARPAVLSTGVRVGETAACR